ncbi:hypothetical protein EKD00_07655 [Chlorobium phaeovibrioides]|uniref:Uncharacterized protein n=2 Tax=Chlorobium phaeovibrioides TaxID=1094 RepID=A0A3S0U167_CHLPH|nr:hypothetical protein [Chlorobium phaeovibrioides]HCD36818.1 hypothetical protein [Chlorobium sp.]KAA6231792.1 hypothetical protein FP507_00700 [Chlorobium phaeovibrioides]MWV54145.1 hypothetical protein [Chlorobium phaeovibrioides]RTY34649.1 hypothetical protein EKD00_07655 [Chlorobium phaeovibrioides]RTY37751.1 hypothetical protein EKD02_06405 [Chlorobium phaeovibrioides]
MLIFDVTCSSCLFSPGTFAREGSMYVVDDDGTRVRCMHPLEHKAIEAVLGKDAGVDIVKRRTGRQHQWLCFRCSGVSELDSQVDRVGCALCGSSVGRFFYDLDGRPCPSCGEGPMKVVETGLVS